MRADGIDPHSFVSSKEGIPAARLHEELLALDEQGGYCYSMNSSAARIWEMIGTPIALDVLCANLCREFAVDPEVCLRDTREILSEMEAAGLVRISHAPSD